MKDRLVIGLVAALAAATSAWAQDAGEDGMVTGAAQNRAPTIDRVEDVVVTRGSRMDGFSFEDYTRDYVAEIARPVSPRFGIARWNARRRLCVGTMNIPADAGQFVINRISDIAEDVGLKPGLPGCRADILILFTADAPTLARRMVDEKPKMFRPFGGTGGTTQGLHAMEDFASSDAPVRWWQVTMPMTWDDSPAVILSQAPGSEAVLGGYIYTAGSNSRLSNLVKDEIWQTYIIVDVGAAEGMDWSRLADYLAVVALAQIDPKADTSGYPTVLNLFDAPASTTGLTAWDLSFLRALYRFDQLRQPGIQPGLLVDIMLRDQESGGE